MIDLNSFAQGMAANQASPLLQPRMEVQQVNGEAGARGLAIGPNSSVIALDKTKSNVFWFIMTDQMGQKVTVDPYTYAPYIPEPEPDLKSIEKTLQELSSRMAKMEEVLK